MTLARISSLVLLSVALAPWSNPAHAAASDWVGDRHVAVRLIAAADSVGAGSTLQAGLEFRFAKGWHGYWRTPGDAGVAPMLDWTGSENIAREEVAWPAPSRSVSEDLQTVVYDHDVVLPLTLSLRQPGAAARIHLSVLHGGCSEICVPYQADLSLALPAGSGAASPEAALIDAARKTVPGTPASAGIEVTGAHVAGTATGPALLVDLRSHDKPFARPDLFVEGTGDGIPAAPTVELEAGGQNAHLTVRLPPLPPGDRPLTVTLTDQDRAAEFVVIAQ